MFTWFALLALLSPSVSAVENNFRPPAASQLRGAIDRSNTSSNPAIYDPNAAANSGSDPSAVAPGGNPGAGPSFQLPDPNSPQPQPNQPGKYTNADGTVRMDEKLRDVLKNSVVEVVAYDQSNAPLRKSMGVAVGKVASGEQVIERNYIAVPLPLIMGNNLQWADRIEVMHHTGSKYSAKIALIDEKLKLAILHPEIEPQPIRFIPDENERNQIKVVMIKFNRNQKQEIVPDVYWGEVSALSKTNGSMIVSGNNIDSSMAGTGIINMKGELVGMLLPGGHGVLSSTIRKRLRQIEDSTPIDPQMVGVIMGKGVVVDTNLEKKNEGAFPTISAAIEAIRKKEAPKANEKLFIADPDHKDEEDRVILKIHPGEYVEPQPIRLPSKISITGSGPDKTVISTTNIAKPVFEIHSVQDVSIANLRIKAPPLQNQEIAVVDILNSNNIFVLGNTIEAFGGNGVNFRNSQASAAFANTFSGKDAKGLYCNNSTVLIKANAFVDKWSQALAIGSDCYASAARNFFHENKVALAVASETAKVEISKNTFIQTTVGIRYYGNFPPGKAIDNLFYRNTYSIFTAAPPAAEMFKRNSSWRSIAANKGATIKNIGMMKSQPKFRAPKNFDFRLRAGSAQFGAGIPDEKGLPTDIGAFQNSDFLGMYSIQLANSLGTALARKNLGQAWGLVPKSETAQP